MVLSKYRWRSLDQSITISDRINGLEMKAFQFGATTTVTVPRVGVTRVPVPAIPITMMPVV